MGLRLGVIASVTAHAGALAALALLGAPLGAGAPAAPPSAATTSVPVGVVVAPASTVPEAMHEGPIIPLPAGPGDVALASSSSPLPSAEVDVPDRRRAAPGGGDPGGTVAWTARHDAAELRAQPWNDPARYRIPRIATAHDRATTEALARIPDPSVGASLRAPSRQARRATVQASATPTGLTPAPGQAGDSDASGRPVTGAADPRRERPLVETGAPAVDAARHGVVRDDVTAAQASDERQPEEYDLTRARAGGTDSGVAGAHAAPGDAADSDHGDGDGASPLDVPVGRGPVATRARLGDPYLRALYARVMERVVWPRRLAVAFEQGEVIVHFTLGQGGAVETLRVDRSSGHSEFDDAVLAAIRAAGPFGPVPSSLSPPGQKLQVSAPFVFDNPMIR